MASSLRRLVDAVCVVAAAGMIVGISTHLHGRVAEKRKIDQVAADVERFRQVLHYRAASNSDQVNQRGWPTTVDPEWFGGTPPRNVLVSAEQPWVEIASQEEAPLTDPLVRMTVNPLVASFWYNPYQGIIRARVPVTINDRRALAMYNAVNSTALDSIYCKEMPAPLLGLEAPVEEPAPEAVATVAEEPESLDPTIPLPPRQPAPAPEKKTRPK